MEASLNLEQYLELLLGPRDAGSAFDSDESRRDFVAVSLGGADPTGRTGIASLGVVGI